MPDRDTTTFEHPEPLSSSPTGANYLLAIAIDNYPNFTKLNNAVLDAEAIEEVLTTRYNFRTVAFLKNETATKKGIELAFHNLIDIIKEQDKLIIYFSGHGHYNKAHGGYWTVLVVAKQ